MEVRLVRRATQDSVFAAALAGDREAFAAIYDRYGDRIHDFCWALLHDRDEAADVTVETFVVAARGLRRLHHPSQLRSWLYGIARRRALRRLRTRGRVTGAGAVAQMPVDDGHERAVDKRALRGLVWNVAGGLPYRDRALLDLHLRQGLDGVELGEAMGIRAEQTVARLVRLRDELEWSVSALLVARLGPRDCPALMTLMTDWDGRLTPSGRRRIAGHVDGCKPCSECRDGLVSPVALLSAVPMAPAPPAVRRKVMQEAKLRSRRHSAIRRRGAGLTARALTASMLLVLGGAGFWVGSLLVPSPEQVVSGTLSVPPLTLNTPEPLAATPERQPDPEVEALPPATDDDQQADASAANTAHAEPPPARPAALTLSTTEVDLGAEQEQGAVSLGNSGDEALDWAISTEARWLTLQPPDGRLEGGETAQVHIRADRGMLPEGPAEVMIDLTSNAGDVRVLVRLVVERPPEITSRGATPASLTVEGCEPSTAAVTAVVSDETALAAVTLEWTGSDDARGSAPMTDSGDSWSGSLGPFTEPGTVTWWIIATDTRDNVIRTGESMLPVQACDDDTETAPPEPPPANSGGKPPGLSDDGPPGHQRGNGA